MATVVNDAHPFSREESVDLSRLNDGERRVLRLLAEGHTAKSIAVAIDATPAAINERLREARRKTGVGSSRELARLLRAQESRDEIIGVAIVPTGGAAITPSDARRRPLAGVFAMIALFLLAAAGAAALMTQASPTGSTDIDPLIGSPLVHTPDLATFHEKVRAEARDERWAGGMENRIRARVMQIPLVGKGGNVLRVTCGQSLCEIAGTLVSPKDKAEIEDQKSQFNLTTRALQVPPLPDDLAKLGLKFEGANFTSGKAQPDSMIFLLYYSRTT